LNKEILNSLRLRWARIVAYSFPFVEYVLHRRETIFQRTAESIYLSHKGVVLDVGTGTGRLPFILGKMESPQYCLGIDLNIVLLKNAQKNIEEANIDNRVSFAGADIQFLPLQDSSVGMAVSIASIQQWYNRKRGLEELYRVLKHHGVLLILVGPALLWFFDITRRNMRNQRNIKNILRTIGFREVFAEKVMVNEPKPGTNMLLLFALK
jgi:SAM-dependent methyltransferase